jgi:hypothetical protein
MATQSTVLSIKGSILSRLRHSEFIGNILGIIGKKQLTSDRKADKTI